MIVETVYGGRVWHGKIDLKRSATSESDTIVENVHKVLQ